jgi:hypothetical protein
MKAKTVTFFLIFKTTYGFLKGKIQRDKSEKGEIKFQQLRMEFTHTVYKIN